MTQFVHLLWKKTESYMKTITVHTERIREEFTVVLEVYSVIIKE